MGLVILCNLCFIVQTKFGNNHSSYIFNEVIELCQCICKLLPVEQITCYSIIVRETKPTSSEFFSVTCNLIHLCLRSSLHCKIGIKNYSDDVNLYIQCKNYWSSWYFRWYAFSIFLSIFSTKIQMKGQIEALVDFFWHVFDWFVGFDVNLKWLGPVLVRIISWKKLPRYLTLYCFRLENRTFMIVILKLLMYR